MLFLLQCTVFVSTRFDLNLQDCYVYACDLAVGKNQSDFIPRYFSQVIVALYPGFKAPSTRIRLFLNPQFFLCGFKNFRVHTSLLHSRF